RHDPALPLYTEADARAVTPLLRVVPVGEPVELDGFRLTFRVAGHILGAASALLETEDGSVLFSGDLGRPDDLLIPPPDPPPAADTVVMESTYGGRDHPVLYPAAALALVLRRTARRGGVLMIPSFAVGRAQLMLYALWKIFSEGRAPRVPVFLNSPMAIDVTDLYEKYAAFHRLSTEECRSAFSVAEYVESVEESRALNGRAGPMVIIAGAGMLTGGRILHHIRQFAPHPRNTLLLTGFQAEGTRGAALQRGEPTLRVHGRSVPIRAEVATMDGLSAHADQSELLDWLAALPAPPRNVFLVHGEPAQSEALRLAARERLGMDLRVAEHRQTVTLR
ncbi:MAG: MBL fold metallo-hydrolase, partial [Gemmatimonadota bacterium]|nr:MBL fold metallo-hydrolase [Gemmatimonadota bacterium]